MSFCQTMSDLLSPLKSPVALMCQAGPGLNEPMAPTEVLLVPFINQAAAVPLPLCHRMSDLLSPLKSGTAASFCAVTFTTSAKPAPVFSKYFRLPPFSPMTGSRSPSPSRSAKSAR